MKARALMPALALAAALLAPPLTEADSRHYSDHGHRPPAHGYYGHHRGHGYYDGYDGYYYRAPHYYRPYGYYAPPYPYYGYPYGYGYGYGYGYYPPPPPRYCPPRPHISFWIGF